MDTDEAATAGETNDTDSLLESLTRLLDEQLGKEMIGGTALGSVIEHVDLSVAYSPVCPYPAEENGMYIPQVAKVTALQGDRYFVECDGRQWFVQPESLRIMRARFLLWRGFYHDRLAQGGMSHSDQAEVVGKFFDGHLYIPNALLPKDRQVEGVRHMLGRQPDNRRIGTIHEEGRSDYASKPPKPLPVDISPISEEQLTKTTLRISCLGCGEQEILPKVGKNWQGWFAFHKSHAKCKLAEEAMGEG